MRLKYLYIFGILFLVSSVTFADKFVPEFNQMKKIRCDIEEIIYALKFSYSSYEDIGKRYGVEGRTISRINNGTYHKQDDISYPIRQYRATKNAGQLTYHQVLEIIELISTTKISLRQIALQYNVTPNIIIGIKNGSTKMYRRDNLVYPLRANN